MQYCYLNNKNWNNELDRSGSLFAFFLSGSKGIVQETECLEHILNTFSSLTLDQILTLREKLITITND